MAVTITRYESIEFCLLDVCGTSDMIWNKNILKVEVSIYGWKHLGFVYFNFYDIRELNDSFKEKNNNF